MNKTPDKFCVLLIYCLLGIVTLVVFGQVSRNDFVGYDDPIYVTDNQYVKGGLTLNNVFWAFGATHSANWHPLTWLSHMLDCQLFGLNPKWHHLINLLFHITNTLLLFWVLKDMTAALWQSAYVAAAFALHPLHVESVAWVAERKDVLSTMFWLLTMAAYLRYARAGGAKWYMGTLFLFALGLMAKPMLITLPFVLLLLDYWPLERLSRNKKCDIRYIIYEKAPFFALLAASGFITFIAQQGSRAMVSVDALPLKLRLANTAVSYIRYIWNMIWPARLAVFYPYRGEKEMIQPDQLVAFYPYRGEKLSFWLVSASVLVLLAVTILVVRLASKHRYLFTGWFWYLGTLVPVIGLVQVGYQTRADRYTYIPLTGLFIIIAWALPELLAGWRHRKALLGILAATVLLALSICTHLQLRYWRNSVSLFTHTLAVTSDNYVIHNSLGLTLQSQGKLDEAIAQYRQSLDINPLYEHANFNMGAVLYSQGKIEQAVDYYKRTILASPDYIYAHYSLAVALKALGRSDEAIEHLRLAVKFKPDFAQAYNEMGSIMLARNKLDEAAGYYQRAIQAKPDYAEAHYNLGTVFITQGRYNQAADCFQDALRIKPDYVEAHCNLGAVLKSQGRVDEAIEHYKQAMKVKPDAPEVHNNLGNALLAQGRGEEAIDQFHQAVKLRPNFAEAYFNLGYAFQLQGRLDEVERCYRQALQIDPNHTAASQALRELLKNTK